MGFRFNKRLKVFKGLTLNLSKSGTSWTIGRPGASINVRKDKISGSVGVPGTGMSWRETLSKGDSSRSPQRGGNTGKIMFWFVVLTLLGYLLGR